MALTKKLTQGYYYIMGLCPKKGYISKWIKILEGLFATWTYN